MLLVAALTLAVCWLCARIFSASSPTARTDAGQADAGDSALALKLQQERALFAGVLDASRNCSIVGTDINGVVTLFAAGAERLLGYQANEVLGKASVLLFHDAQEVRQRAEQMGTNPGIDVFRALPALGQADEREWTYVTKTGRRVPVWLTVTAVADAQGSLTGFVGLARDISLDKQAQHDRDGFLNVGQELLCKVDKFGRILSASPSFVRVLQHPPQDVVGRLITDFVHPDDHVPTHLRLSELNNGQSVYHFENRWLAKDGSYRTISWHGIVPYANGVSYGGGLDVTEQKRREQERQTWAAREKRLMGIVSHDLRNPLTTIAMAAELIGRATPGHATVARNLQRIVQSCARAERLIHDVLDYSQARHTGGITVKLAPIDLSALVQRVVDEMALVHPGRALEVDAPATLPAVADSDRLEQLLSNLLTNGLKYGPSGQPVQVVLRKTPAATTLAVHNDGPPISPQLLPHLFEPFRRGSKDGDAQHHSVGLGLYIVQEVARAHGGEVEVESSASAGTRFRVVLPDDAHPQGSEP